MTEKLTDRDILLQLCACLTLADHMGDAFTYVHKALKLAGVTVVEETGDERDVAKALHKLGVTTLYGTVIGDQL